MISRGQVRTIVVAVLCGVMSGLRVAAAPSPESLRVECAYGVTLALEGRLAAAESVFTSLLSHAPGDSRALANLGNLHLLRGEREAALAFYALAARMDSSDAGILLNCATTHYLMGEDSLARAEASDAVARSGGSALAESLLGLKRRQATDESPKAADMSASMRFPVRRVVRGQRTALTRDELRALLASRGPRAATAPLRRAGAAVDTSASSHIANGVPGSYETNAAAVLYWKR